MPSKKGLPSGVGLKHDTHYVEELTKVSRAIGKTLPIDKIEPNPRQPRTEMGDLMELANSIKQRGVLEPILVAPNRSKGTWTIIAGERRWRAASMAGLAEIPCIELDLSENEIAEIALIENLQRKDLTVWEEADGLAALARRFGYKHDEIARKIGKSRSSVTEAITIANLPESVRNKCIELNISAKSTLLEIARQVDEEHMLKFLDNLANLPSRSREDARKLSKQKNKIPVSDSSEKVSKSVIEKEESGSERKSERISDSEEISGEKSFSVYGEEIAKKKVFSFEHKGIKIEIFSSSSAVSKELLLEVLGECILKLKER